MFYSRGTPFQISQSSLMFRRKSTGIRIPLQQVLPAYRIVPTIVIEPDIERIPDLSEDKE